MNPGTRRDPFLKAKYYLTKGYRLAKGKLIGTFLRASDEKRLKEISREERTRLASLARKYSDLQQGVSVIIGTHKGEKVIDRCLESLAGQTLDPSLFEVIFIINGERDQTDRKIQNFFSVHPEIDYSVLYLERPSLGAARNVGFKAAQKKFACFLDDDDFLSENYLEEMLAMCDNTTVAISQLVDVDENGRMDPDNPINQEILGNRKIRASQMMRLKRGISMSGGKMFPTMLVKEHSIRDELKSGEDIVFFTELFTNWDLAFRIAPPSKKVIYYRLLRRGSMSRREISYGFNVTERIAVLTYLENQLSRVRYPHRIDYIRMRIRAQAGFIKQFLDENPEQKSKVCADIVRAKLAHFPFEMLNHGKAVKLVVSYCFPPYVDTSGTVVAKRIRAAGELVDAVYNKMDGRRDVNPNLSLLAGEFIDHQVELDTPTTFSGWNGIEKFIRKGIGAIQLQAGKKGHYSRLYSRAMWPASHLLAYEYKSRHQPVEWTAEFSDPVLHDIHGEERRSSIGDPGLLNRLKSDVKRANMPVPATENLFFWCEYLPYVFADTIIFTNENQRRYMLNRFPVDGIGQMVMEKSVISHHPILPEMFYHIQESDYPVDPSFVNLAYFGVFYQTRKLDELVKAIEQLDEEQVRKLKIHIFTDNPDLFRDEIKGSKLEQVFMVGPYVDYFEFLNLCTRFDCLIVNDAITRHVKDINPYLPSKLSDYLGSGVPVWGLFEEGSVLSTQEIGYKSPIGEVESTKDMLLRIIEDTHRSRR